MAHPREDDAVEGQDLAETVDEASITPDGDDIAISDTRPGAREVATVKAGGFDVVGEGSPPCNDPSIDERLDHGLQDTFPASDPLSINPGAD